MKSVQSFFILFISGILFFSACRQNISKTDDALSSIPENVSTLTAVDLPVLMEKADFEKVKTMEFYQEIIEEAREYNPVLGEVAADPEKSGIDLDQKFYFVHDVDPQNIEDILMAAVFSVKDASKFESLVENSSKGNIKEMGAYKLYQKRDQTIAWNDEIALIGTYYSYNDVNPKIARYFNSEAAGSIADNQGLQKSLSENHDINSWMNSNVIAENQQLQLYLPLIKIDPEALKNNTVHSYVDFNKGEVDGKSILKLNEGLAKDLDQLFKDEVKTDFSNYVPAENLNTLMTAAFDFNGLKEVISARPQGMSFVNFTLKEFGLTFDDITNTFGGDMLFSISGKQRDPLGLFATNITDENTLQKFFDLAIEYEIIEKVSDKRYSFKKSGMGGFAPSYGYPVHLLLEDGILFASSNQETINTIEAGGFKGKEKVDKKLLNELSNNVFGLFMDYEALAKVMGEEKIDLTTLKLTTKQRTSKFNLKFSDKSTNSLKQLFEFANEQYVKDQKARAGSEI